ncbi:MAG: hypothetical protein CMK92_01040, partial [Pseudomonas sp.]|nr:hypothetical protein [Pseudomonas sp.]
MVTLDENTTITFLAISIIIGVLALVFALLAYTEDDNTSIILGTGDLENNTFPVWRDGKFVSSVMTQGEADDVVNMDSMVKVTRQVQQSQDTFGAGPMTLGNNGSQLSCRIPGTTAQSFFVTSDATDAGSSEAFQWKFGQRITSPSIANPVIEETSVDGVIEIVTNATAAIRFFGWTYDVVRGDVSINLQVFFTDGDDADTPVFDYFQATGGDYVQLVSNSQIDVVFPSTIFFEPNRQLRVVLTAVNEGDVFSLLGDNVGTDNAWIPASTTDLQFAERITFTDTETTVNSALTEYDIYVEEGATGTTGTVLDPFGTVQEGVDAAQEGDTIFIGGTFIITEPVLVNKSVTIVGREGIRSSIAYPVFTPLNNPCILVVGGFTVQFNIRFVQCINGSYGIDGSNMIFCGIISCNFINNGWNGEGLNTDGVADGTNVGYDSSKTDLEAFAASDNVGSEGGGIR